jgi:hypothetical protein
MAKASAWNLTRTATAQLVERFTGNPAVLPLESLELWSLKVKNPKTCFCA